MSLFPQIAVVDFSSLANCTLQGTTGTWLVPPPASFDGLNAAYAVAVAPASCTYSCGKGDATLVVTVSPNPTSGQTDPVVTVQGGKAVTGAATLALVSVSPV